MEIHILGAHNCESENSRYMSLLIDNTLALDAGGLTSSLSLSAQGQIKAVLLTHQHYDHVRDIPALAMNFYLNHGARLKIYSTEAVRKALATFLLNGELYPKFLEQPADRPVIDFTTLELNKPVQIEGYTAKAVTVGHSVPAVGYELTTPNGKTLFYTGDTGPGLAACWEKVSPQLLLIEVTAPDRFESFALQSKHLTPGLLFQELEAFRRIKGYLPTVVVVHINPRQEDDIKAELKVVAGSLQASITPAYEGMKIHL